MYVYMCVYIYIPGATTPLQPLRHCNDRSAEYGTIIDV